MDYRGKILQMDLGNNNHATAYVCTGHHNGQIEVVSVVEGLEAVEFTPISLSNVVIRNYWEEPSTIESVRKRIKAIIKEGIEKGKVDCDNLERMHRNLSRLDSLDGDETSMLLPPVPEKSCAARISRPDYVGKLLFLEFPWDCEGACDSGEFIIIAQSDNSLYAVKTDSCLNGIYVGRIPFTAGDRSISILSVVEDDEFIQGFIDRLDDMTTADYPPEACDAAETGSRQLVRMLASKNPMSLDEFFQASADAIFGVIGCHSGDCQNCSCH